MKQCIELVTVGKMGIKFNFVLNPVRFKLIRLLLQFILALIGVLASERFQILLKNSKKKKRKEIWYTLKECERQDKQRNNRNNKKTSSKAKQIDIQ